MSPGTLSTPGEQISDPFPPQLEGELDSSFVLSPGFNVVAITELCTDKLLFKKCRVLDLLAFSFRLWTLDLISLSVCLDRLRMLWVTNCAIIFRITHIPLRLFCIAIACSAYIFYNVIRSVSTVGALIRKVSGSSVDPYCKAPVTVVIGGSGSPVPRIEQRQPSPNALFC
jgi:hypothetical protein